VRRRRDREEILGGGGGGAAFRDADFGVGTDFFCEAGLMGGLEGVVSDRFAGVAEFIEPRECLVNLFFPWG
jgi:hypothetical protein